MADFLTWDATDRESLYRRTVQVSADLVDSHVPYEARLVTMGTLIVAIAQRIRTIAKHSEIAVVFVVANAIRMHRETVKNRPRNVKAGANPWPSIQKALEQTGTLCIDLGRDAPFHRLVSKLARVEQVSCPDVWRRMCDLDIWTWQGGMDVVQRHLEATCHHEEQSLGKRSRHAPLLLPTDPQEGIRESSSPVEVTTSSPPVLSLQPARVPKQISKSRRLLANRHASSRPMKNVPLRLRGTCVVGLLRRAVEKAGAKTARIARCKRVLQRTRRNAPTTISAPKKVWETAWGAQK